MQQDKSFAIQCGWTEDLIIIDKRDLGVSGQLRMEDRLAFRDMLRRAEGKEGEEKSIRAIIARDVSRLFRNKWGDEPGKFMEICHRFNILVVTADFVYDFSISWHIDKFKRKCEEAWNHIENHVFGVMLPAMDERGRAGYWVGGNLPMGFIIDRQEKIKGEINPNYNRFLVYEPHAQAIRWIFRRFKQLCGNVRALLIEIERLPVLFPDFEEWIPDVAVNAFKNYKIVPGGYTIASDKGLRNALTNRVYIGHWIYQGEVVSTNNHPAIVDFDDFLFAYNRLSLIRLDGTTNEDSLRFRQKHARNYSKRQEGILQECILQECIESADPLIRIYPNYAMPRDETLWYYGLYPRGVGSKQHLVLSSIPSRPVDDIVLNRLIERMQEPEAEKDLADFLVYEDKAVTEASETLSDIERDIIAAKALMVRIKAQVESGKLTNPDLLDAANTSYNVAQADIERHSSTSMPL